MKSLMLIPVLIASAMLYCSQSPTADSTASPVTLRPLMKLGTNLSINDVHDANMELFADEVSVNTFPLEVFPAQSRLSGSVEIPPQSSTCSLVVRMYDDLGRLIGQGGYKITNADRQFQYCQIGPIGVHSAKPHIQQFTCSESIVQQGDEITLQATASDSFGGTIETYSFKIGSGTWKPGSINTLTTLVPALNNGSLICSLQVTDDDGNTSFSSLTLSESCSGLTIISPNGGESYTIGQSVTITWCTPADYTGQLILRYSSDGGLSYTTLNTTGSIPASDQSFTFTLSSGMEGTECLVQIQDYNNTDNSDESDGFFTVEYYQLAAF
jgi:hypothetical protein